MNTIYDAIVIGGSYAGMAAALQLARARRTVLVIDAAKRRNRFAATSHGFITQDGVAPGEIAEQARAQLLKYSTVEWKSATVTQASGHKDAFDVTTENGEQFKAKRLILAGGVVDQLPTLPGLAERWGSSVFHCPYCHGYELNQEAIGVLARSEHSMHQALMLPDWGSTTFFLNDQFAPNPEQLQALAQRNVTVVSGPIAALEGPALTLRMLNGKTFELAGLFTMAQTSIDPIASQLQCALDSGPTGSFVKTNETKATTVDGVFACGDLARAAGSVSLAVGDGAMAGAATHRSLIFP